VVVGPSRHLLREGPVAHELLMQARALAIGENPRRELECVVIRFAGGWNGPAVEEPRRLGV